jgi:hypothetical protein
VKAVPYRMWAACAVLLAACGAPVSPPLTVVKDRAVDAPLRAATEDE